MLISGNLPDTLAQSCTTSPRAEGLVSARQQDPTSKFGSLAGVCIIDPNAAFRSFKIPTYDSLKSLYYDQSKLPASDKFKITGDTGEGGLSTQLSAGKKLIYITGNLGMNNNISGSNTAIVFIDGILLFGSPMTQFTYGNPTSGIVFIVKGNVIIDTSVTRIDAVLISQGTIYTAGAGCNSPTSAPQLTINGSLVSLNAAAPIRFCRSLTDNTIAAEIINHQVKDLVILRNLIFDNPIKWSEVAK